MGIITFLKKRYKEHLVTKLNKLKKLSDEYSKSVDAYDESIKSIKLKQNQITDLWISHYFNPYFEYLSEELTKSYDLHSYFSFLHNRTVSKIKRLENKISKL